MRDKNGAPLTEGAARLRLAVSMTAFGTLGLFVRFIPLPSGELALYRAVLAVVVLSGFFLLTGRRPELKGAGRALLLLLLSGAAMGFNWILLFQAYKYTTVSVATLSYYFAPVLVTILSPLLFRERPTARQVLCFIMSTVGMAMLVGGAGLGEGSSHLLGVLFGLGAAVLYATVILLNKGIRDVPGLQRTLLQFLSAILVLIPYVALTGGSHLGALDAMGWGSLLVVGLFHTGVTYCLYFSALGVLRGQETALLSYIDPLVALLLSVTVLQETLTLPQAAGGLLILGFTFWDQLGKK